MKRLLFKITLLILAVTALSKPVVAQEGKTTIHFFWSNGCPHCAKEKAFLEDLMQEDPGITVKGYETSIYKNALILLRVGKRLNANTSGIPFTVIGDQYFVGYGDDETTGELIKELVQQTRENKTSDIVEEIIEIVPSSTPANTDDPSIPDTIKLPFLGSVNIKQLSLPVLTLVLALADGFNPCAMWVLLFLISLLLGMQDRKKMWLIGSTFIIASGFVYFLFLTAWLNLFLFLGYINWIRMVIGGVALYSGYRYLSDYIKNKDGGCEVVGGNETRKKIFEKARALITEKNLLISLGGIALLAFGINIVEFMCSAGLPAIYTKVLALNSLPTWKYYAYMLFYVTIFMIDDMVVFIIAMTTLKAVGIESKYARYSHLVGGILMLAIGLLMIFKPEILMLG